MEGTLQCLSLRLGQDRWKPPACSCRLHVFQVQPRKLSWAFLRMLQPKLWRSASLGDQFVLFPHALCRVTRSWFLREAQEGTDPLYVLISQTMLAKTEHPALPQDSIRCCWAGLEPPSQSLWECCLVRTGLCPWPSDLPVSWTFDVVHTCLKYNLQIWQEKWLARPVRSHSPFSGKISTIQGTPVSCLPSHLKQSRLKWYFKFPQ